MFIENAFTGRTSVEMNRAARVLRHAPVNAAKKARNDTMPGGRARGCYRHVQLRSLRLFDVIYLINHVDKLLFFAMRRFIRLRLRSDTLIALEG